jgi:8-oxo-dGTP pyrophosphatase MutT (NUDIX family)
VSVSEPPDRAAAVCYRIRDGQVQFLIVRTSDDDAWTFPKGRPDPDDDDFRGTALREACEEAGVHGDLDAQPLLRYAFPGKRERLVEAYLLHVLSTGRPRGKERDRKPTWLDPAQTRGRLAENRSERYAAEHARVVDAAEQRIAELNRG